MRFVSTNYLLYKMSKVTSQTCSFCKIFPETIDHLFYDCNLVKNIWLYIFSKLFQISNNRLVCSLKLCLLGMYDKQNVNRDLWLVVNTVIVLVKSHIMACKYNGDIVSTQSLIQYIQLKCDTLSILNGSVFETINRMITRDTYGLM